ncbi:beta-1,3-galactosyltransferase 5-like isoform X1 [Epinephelus moara]|uniref:beta-1,3-galactosyltransferase 5-like isoform X1 n=2 Tax=Epinephelus moara TaxID=300413 RepID=UPI00214F4655|nr:beta-1,3-galactosyltransferase 5-like isoform X1 [Epinephelus moara]
MGDICMVWNKRTLMENGRRHLKHIFVCILGAVTIFFIYLNCDWELASRDFPAAASSSLSLSSSSSSSSSPSSPSSSTSLSAAAEPRWEDPGPYHVAYPRNYKFIMDDTLTCKNTTPFLVLMVPVAPNDIAARDTIRKTWGNEKLVLGQLVETLFILGLPGGADAEQQQEKLKQENLQHHDLIQSNFQDSYRNLTVKTMMMLEWLAAHCVNAAYVMKIDSDMLLHVPNLVKLLLSPSTAKENYMTGLVWWHSPVLRNPFNKFYMPRGVIAESEYPPYPLGMAYVMSLDLPAKILSVSPQIKPIYIEDAYLGMCLKRLGISPTDPPENTMFIVDPRHPLSSCSLSKVIAVTTTSIPQMTSYWERSRQPEAKC